QSRMLSYIQLDGAADTALFDHYLVSLSHQRHDEERYRKRSDGRVDIQGFELDSFGASVQLDKALDWTDVVYGASYYQDRVDSFRDDYNADGSFKGSKIQGPVGDDGVWHLADVFVNTSTPVGERLTVDLGTRYTYAETTIGKVESPETGDPYSIHDSWDQLVGSGRASYRLDQTDQWRVFGGVSQAFRAPNFSDLSRLDSNRSNEIETPVPGLGPEKFLTYEIGLKTQTDRYEAQLSYYYTHIDDLILRTPTGRVVDGLQEVTKSNVGEGHVQGFELSGAIEIVENVRLFGGFAWQDSQVSTYPTSAPVLADEPLSRLLPTSGFGGLRVDLADGRAWIEGLVTAVSHADRLSSSDIRDTQRIPPGGTPAYWLATLRTGCDVRENIRLTAAIENVFDEEYRAHGSGQNEPGINFVFGAEIRF
ncbi:MAG: TonB-dependent receptor, partial [Verrucomicrobiae bacterium]|nr:TonB-dependent receptor [Verrucomicrobiae bacterium]